MGVRLMSVAQVTMTQHDADYIFCPRVAAPTACQKCEQALPVKLCDVHNLPRPVFDLRAAVNASCV